MFIRPSFITNSSGTNFVGWGISFDLDNLNEIDMDDEELREKFGTAEESCENIEIHYPNEAEVFINVANSGWGCDEGTASKLEGSFEIDPRWYRLLREFFVAAGLNPDDFINENNSPGWYSVNYRDW